MQPDINPYNIAAGSLEDSLGRPRWLIGIACDVEHGQELLIVHVDRKRRASLSLMKIPPEWCGFPVVIREWDEGGGAADADH